MPRKPNQLKSTTELTVQQRQFVDILVENCKNIDTSFPTFIEIANNIGMDIKIND